MVVVDVIERPSIDLLRLAVGRHFVKQVVFVEDEELAVGRPVGRFDMIGREIRDLAIRRRNGHDLERASYPHRRGAGGSRRRVQFDVGEFRRFGDSVVVGANGEADGCKGWPSAATDMMA